ncbi:hypothetical protein GCM10022220_33900 [Actinocatenispora rupis]|uniref:HTH luxR-type domain-containing protein n=2 Tax=Actinocatenispora rupis TaxID=519421 RepID=A0A8J3J1N0_9ACTN|nr:hypothetical protein Aru02nite_37890 [Actinocatenispora rupis]
MVGRDEDLATVDAAWRQLREEPQHARIVVVTGDAGAGKSRLVAEAVARLDPAPGLVLSGQSRAVGPAPYDWMASALSGRSLDGIDVPDDALAWLTQRPELPDRRFAPEALLRAGVDAVRAVQRGRPGVLVVEDLHDLDPASLDLVSELAVAADLPVLLMVTSRSATGLAARVLARVSGTPRSVRRHLGPLAATDVAAVVEAVLGAPATDAVVAAAHRRTGGNPYWLSELLATAPEALGGPPPAHLAALAADRVPADALRVARAAALLGEPVDTVALGRVCDDAEAGIDRLVAAGVLRVDVDGGMRFAYPVLAEGLAAGALPSLRTAVAREVGPAAPDDGLLTAREREVIRLLAAGMTNQQMARALGISIRTVTVHVSNLLRKTGAASRTEAALWAVRHGLADRPAG